jgi:LysR family transcriptional regulator, benzoate and cis,cis-muconate-responsive activator of ben and cat genes
MLSPSYTRSVWVNVMEFRQLRYFVAVAEEGNLTAAARRLHVSQPPITRQIRQLEEELRVELLVRSSKGVLLTEAGQLFFAEAKRVLNISHAAIEKSRAAQAGEVGRLDIGYFGSTIYTVVPQLVRTFLKSRPNITVKIQRASKDEQMARLRDGQIGIGFARYYSVERDIQAIRVGEERLYIAERIDGGQPETVATGIEKIDGRSFIVFPQLGRPSFADEVLRFLMTVDVQPSMTDSAEDVFAALAMVLVSDSLCIVPESVAKLAWPEIKFSPITHPAAVSPISCIFLRAGRSAVVDAFLSSLAAGDSAAV